MSLFVRSFAGKDFFIETALKKTVLSIVAEKNMKDNFPWNGQTIVYLSQTVVICLRIINN